MRSVMKKSVAVLLLSSLLLLSLTGCLAEDKDKETYVSIKEPTDASDELSSNDNNQISKDKTSSESELSAKTPMSRQELLKKMKESFSVGDDGNSVSFIADIFAQQAAISSYYSSLTVKIVEDDIYFEDILYDRFEVVDNSQIGYSDFMTKLEEFTAEEEFLSIMGSLKESVKCYIFETQSDKYFSKKIGVLEIEGTYYLLSFFDSDTVTRIYCAGERMSDTPKQKLIDLMKRDLSIVAQENKINFSAELLAGSESISSSYPSIAIEIYLDNIYVNGVLYDQLEIADNSQIKFVEETLKNANTSISDEELRNVINTLKSSEKCYRLFAKDINEFFPCVAVYKVGDTYYFASFANNRTVVAIHCVVNKGGQR